MAQLRRSIQGMKARSEEPRALSSLVRSDDPFSLSFRARRTRYATTLRTVTCCRKLRLVGSHELEPLSTSHRSRICRGSSARRARHCQPRQQQ